MHAILVIVKLIVIVLIVIVLLAFLAGMSQTCLPKFG